MSTEDIVRVAAGVPTGGQFASHDRPEGPELAFGPGAPGFRCPSCNTDLHANDETSDIDGLCLPCSDEGTYYRCRDCQTVTEEDGQGWDGMCGACADAAEPKPCDECGEPMRLNDDGTTNHADYDGDIDHDADGDHVALNAELEHAAVLDRIAAELSGVDRDRIELALTRTDFTAADIVRAEPVGRGFDLVFDREHPTGGYDAIRFIPGDEGSVVIAHMRGDANHRLDGFAFERTGRKAEKVAVVGGYTQFPQSDQGWSSFRREGAVNIWERDGGHTVRHDVTPGAETVRFYKDGELHRTGGPAVIAGGELQWWLNGVQYESPAAPARSETYVGSVSTITGEKYDPADSAGEVATKLNSHFARAFQLGTLNAPARARVEDGKIIVSSRGSDAYDIALGYNRVVRDRVAQSSVMDRGMAMEYTD